MSNREETIEEVIKVVKKVIDAKENINKEINTLIELDDKYINTQNRVELWTTAKEINNIIETIIKESSIDYDRYLNYIIAAKNKDNKYD